MRTLSSSPCQLRLGVVLRCHCLSPYTSCHCSFSYIDMTPIYFPYDIFNGLNDISAITPAISAVWHCSQYFAFAKLRITSREQGALAKWPRVHQDADKVSVIQNISVLCTVILILYHWCLYKIILTIMLLFITNYQKLDFHPGLWPNLNPLLILS